MPEKLVLKVSQESPEGLEFELEDSHGELRANTSLAGSEIAELGGCAQKMMAALNSLLEPPTQILSHLDNLAQGLDQLIPPSIADRLSQARGFVELHSHAVDLPWELADSVTTLVTRLPKTVQVLKSIEHDRCAWVGHNATGLEEWAGPEAEACLTGLESVGFQVSSHQGRELTRRGLCAVLSKGRYAIVHLLAYADKEGLILHDGTLSFTELERLSGNARPGLVVLHLSYGPEAFGLTDKAAKALLTAGVPTVLATAWNPNPAQAAKLAGSFYRELGESGLWESLQKAIGACRSPQDPWLSAAAYRAYGDWSHPGGELCALEVQTSQSAPTAKGAWQSDFRFVVLDGPDTGQEIPLFAAALDSGRAITIGRSGARQVDLALQDDTLQNHTASLAKIEDQLVLTNLAGSPDAVKVNGLPLYSPVSLVGWEEIRMGGATCLRFEPTSGQAGMPQGEAFTLQFALEVSEGVPEDLNSRIELAPRVTLVGRQNDCAVMLHDPSVSRHHMTLVPKRNSFFLSAIGESQVVVNGFLLKGEHHLQSGDTVQLSPTTVLKFVKVAS